MLRQLPCFYYIAMVVVSNLMLIQNQLKTGTVSDHLQIRTFDQFKYFFL